MRTTRTNLLAAIGAGLSVLIPVGRVGIAFADDPCKVAWLRQLGTPALDSCDSVAVDYAGNASMCGTTWDMLGGSNAGANDAFLASYDAAGNFLWIRQFGTINSDSATGVAVDAAGNIHVVGNTGGSLAGTHVGGGDAFLAKYDSAGGLLWSRQLGTTTGDYARGGAVDLDGSVYMGGDTLGSLGGPNAGGRDAFLAKYDASGTLLWTRQFGTASEDYVTAVVVDASGNCFLSGHTAGNLGGPSAGGSDAFLAKCDASGNLLWTKQFGTAGQDEATSLAAHPAGGVYSVGYTAGNLAGQSAGSYDAYIARYDDAGNLLWIRQFGTDKWESAHSVAVDAAGNAYATGWTLGELGGLNAGGADAFLVKYDASGLFLGALQLGTSADEHAYDLAIDVTGNARVVGETLGSFGGAHAGHYDAFLIRFDCKAGFPPPPLCYPDCDESGGLDLFDFLCFTNAFNNNDPYADCDDSGNLDLFDFLCFTNTFNEGCP